MRYRRVSGLVASATWTREASAREALRRIGLILDRLGLRLHPEKTRVVFVGDGRVGFDFLGFHHRKVA